MVINEKYIFPASGFRHSSDGTLRDSGRWGFGWAVTASGAGRAWALELSSGTACVYDDWRDFGFPVRCVQASAAVFAFANDTFVFFPASGFRGNGDGVLRDSGRWGFGWAFTPGDARSWALEFVSTLAHVDGLYRDYGFPVRCVQASAAVFVFTKDTFVFFPACGFRHSPDGNLGVSGTWGYGWTSTPGESAGRAWALEFFSGTATVYGDFLDCGFPVRCVQASAAVFAFTKDMFVFFPASGYRGFSDGKLLKSGTWGYEWMSTLGVSGAWGLNFSPAGTGFWDFDRGCGFPVRCVQASVAVWAVRKKEIKQIRYRRESGKARLCRRGQADSVTRLGRKLSVGHSFLPYAALSYLFALIKLPVFDCLYFYKHFSGYFLFFPASGYRGFSDGKVYGSGTNGYGWSSTPNGSSNAWKLGFYSGDAYVNSDSRLDGYSVRCVQASAAVFIFTNDTFVFFPAAGIREYADGQLYNSGVEGNGWTSVPDGDNVFRLIFKSGYAYVTSVARLYGFPVRCVQASATVFAFTKDTFIFFPASGYRGFSDGKLIGLGISVLSWSSQPYTSDSAWELNTRSGNSCMYYDRRDHGFSVRCVQASAAVFVLPAKSFKCFRAYTDIVNDTFVFFPASGYRRVNDGVLREPGVSGYGWSSTPNSNNAWYLYFWSTGPLMANNVRGYGLPVRCVQGSAAVWAVRKENTKQIRYRRESGKGLLCRRGQADSVTRLGRKLSVGHSFLSCAALSYLFALIKLPVFECLYFYKHSSGYFLFFPASGHRNYGDGSLRELGGSGFGWSSTPFNSSYTWYMLFYSGNACMITNNRGYGFPVRCVQAAVAVFAFSNYLKWRKKAA